MAVFDPQVPQGQDMMPNWTRVTSPVDSFQADKSTGIGLATAATSLESGTNIIDTTAKDVIKKDVRNTVEPIRDDFTNQLIQARDQALNGSTGGSGSSATNILPTANSSVPPPNAVQTGLQKVQALQLAQENGHVNDTYYDMRLKTAVTDLRAKYPGYVDYIDSSVSSITGVNPANALVTNLMQDINRLQTNKKTAVDTAINDAMKSGYPYADSMVKNLQDKGEGYLPTFREWYSRQAIQDAQMKRAQAAREANKGTKADVVESRTADFTNESNASLSTHLDAMTTIPGVQTPGKVLDIMADAAANPGKYNDAQMRQLSIGIGVQAAQWESERRARARQISKDGDGKSFSYYSDIGDSAIDATIASGRKAFSLIQDALTKGGPEGMGLAYAQAIHLKATLDGGQDNLVSNKDFGEYATNMSSIRQLFGDQWQQLIVTNGLKNDIDTKMQSFLTNRQTRARLGFDSTGKPVTITQDMDEAKGLEEQGKISSNMRARYTGNLVNLVDDIKNPKAPLEAKQKIVDYIFSPEGQGILGKIKTDYTDPITNKKVPGKYSVFQRLTSDDVVKEVKGMDAEHQQKYKNYLEREAGAEIFQKEFQNLNHFTGHDDIHFKYNDGGTGGIPEITVVDKDGRPLTSSTRQTPTGQSGYGMPMPAAPVSAGYVEQINKIVTRVNSGLAGMSRVEKGFGGNANEYILDFLVNKARVDMGQNWSGLPAKLVDAIAASRAPARKIEDTFKDMK